MNIREEDSLLVDLVKGYPHIYDKQDIDFKNIVKRNNSWKEIGQMLSASASDCQARWGRLRERYSREKKIREMKHKSGSGNITKSSFPLYEQMHFLFKFVKSRRSVPNSTSRQLHSIKMNKSTEKSGFSNISKNEIQSSNENDCNNSTKATLKRVNVPAILTSTSSTIPYISYVPSHTVFPSCSHTSSTGKVEESFLKLTSVVPSHLENKTQNVLFFDMTDEDDIFAKTVACQLKKISEPQKSQIKGQIMKILYTL